MVRTTYRVSAMVALDHTLRVACLVPSLFYLQAQVASVSTPLCPQVGDRVLDQFYHVDERRQCIADFDALSTEPRSKDRSIAFMGNTPVPLPDNPIRLPRFAPGPSHPPLGLETSPNSLAQQNRPPLMACSPAVEIPTIASPMFVDSSASI